MAAAVATPSCELLKAELSFSGRSTDLDWPLDGARGSIRPDDE